MSAGLQSIPLVTGREMQTLNDKAFFTAIIPWSNITVSKISFYVNAAASPVIEVGIYDGLTLLVSNTTTIATAGFQFGTVTLGTPIKLIAGKLYRVGIVDRNKTASTYMENPNYQSPLQWFYTYVAAPPQILPNPIPSYFTNQKPIWFCLY
ncbi:MAG: hypothetical protein IPO21_14650 [Bacteroidales bacterium]|nr:hypothetical protein [Bacteroidales bacterium]